MIDRILDYSIRHRSLVFVAFLIVVGWGAWAVFHTPIDAIPDLSDNQVIVYTEMPGSSPQVIEDQVTYPLVSNLQGLPRLKVVRAQSFFGFSLIYVIFHDDVDIYWARTRVLEKLNYAQGLLPMSVVPRLGPDGTGVGHVYWYTIESDRHDLAELRAIQDWYVRYQLNSVSGVAEVASIGGFVKEYQVDVDPVKLLAYNVSLQHVVESVRKSNQEVGGRLLEMNDEEYVVRGLGYVKTIEDIEKAVVGANKDGTPIFVKNIGVVQLGSAFRRGLLDKNGEGEVVGGIVVMRYGENAKDVISGVKKKIDEITPGLPEGVSILPAYDRSDLIDATIRTLQKTLAEEAVIVCLVVIFFLFHLRSALVVILSIPTAILIAFILMKYFGISSNIMSLSGIAIAIGVLVDASIVMVENAHRYLSEANPTSLEERLKIISRSTKQVGRPVFFSLLIVTLSFAPIFLLEGQEGRLFYPLAFTKTFVMVGATIVAVTLVPALMVLFLKGDIRASERQPINRYLRSIYSPVLVWALARKKRVLVFTFLLFLVSSWMVTRIGKEFMPPLDEGSLLFMPVTLPSVTVTEAKRILQVQDRIISKHPEVEMVLGKLGRAETATDPAPVSMIESIILLKPKEDWRSGITKDDIISELDAQLKIPGVSNAWTQPIINRINMLATGVRTDLGVKIFGKDLNVLQEKVLTAEKILSKIDGAVDVYAERVLGGKFLDIEVDRGAAARLGIHVSDVQDMIRTAIGGEKVSTTVEGQERFPIRVRYARDFRTSPEALKSVLVASVWHWRNPPPPTQVPLGQIADIAFTEGPPVINTENSLPRAVVFLNVRGRDMGGFVDEARAALQEQLTLPEGYFLSWSGQYENQVRAKKRLSLLVPIVIGIIFILLYLAFHSVAESALILLTVPFGFIGGIFLQYILGYNFSVAVWVGYIALAGVVVETGVLMLTYLREPFEKSSASHRMSEIDRNSAIVEAAGLRVRPVLMTTATSLIGLIPIMWASGTGSDVMKPIATPLIGGILSSTFLVLIVVPVLFSILQEKKTI